MTEITALVRDTRSGILALLINVGPAIVDVWVKVLSNPQDEFLMIFLPPLQVALECGSWNIHGRRREG
jgi:hypothetical protein